MISIIVLCILLFPIPALIGYLFRNIDKTTRSLPFFWVSGQVLLWAIFQLLCVPLILLEIPFSTAVDYFNLVTLLLLGTVLVSFLINYCLLKRRQPHMVCKHAPNTSRSKSYHILWGVFAILLIFQLAMIAFMAYEEGDDAFYVAVSTLTVDSDTMYIKLPYTGGATGLDARHGLAPFPIWIAYLAKMSGIPAVTVAQIAAPFSLILMAYSLYYLLGQKLLAEHPVRLPFFMILTELLTIFGGYSVYSAENFVLVRTAQGKAVIANIILPYIFLILLLLLYKVHNKQKISFLHWLLLAFSTIAGCLCSTLGTILICMLLGIVGLCTMISYKRFGIIFPLGACCILPFCYALLYFLLD